MISPMKVWSFPANVFLQFGKLSKIIWYYSGWLRNPPLVDPIINKVSTCFNHHCGGGLRNHPQWDLL